jgi:acetyltransferase-like isoleucine patch superfamily enzyme
MFWQFIRLKIIGAIARRRYAFRALGKGVLLDPTADFSGSNFIEIGDHTWIQKHCWLSVALIGLKNVPSRTVISVGKNCSLGKRTMITASNRVIIKDNVLTSPNVLIMDHNHIYDDPSLPIKDQGITTNGEVTVEENCWIGMNACIITKGRAWRRARRTGTADLGPSRPRRAGTVLRLDNRTGVLRRARKRRLRRSAAMPARSSTKRKKSCPVPDSRSPSPLALTGMGIGNPLASRPDAPHRRSARSSQTT